MAKRQTQSVNLNAASKEELARSPDLGPDRAEEVVRLREAHGGRIHDWSELKEIPGVSNETISNLQEAGFTLD